jgi:hypothetical protein
MLRGLELGPSETPYLNSWPTVLRRPRALQTSVSRFQVAPVSSASRRRGPSPSEISLLAEISSREDAIVISRENFSAVNGLEGSGVLVMHAAATAPHLRTRNIVAFASATQPPW